MSNRAATGRRKEVVITLVFLFFLIKVAYKNIDTEKEEGEKTSRREEF